MSLCHTYKEITMSALFSCCSFFCVFLVDLLRLNSFNTTGRIGEVVLLPVGLRGIFFMQRIIKNGPCEGCRKGFPCQCNYRYYRLYRRAAHSVPGQVCDAPDNSEDLRWPHAPNTRLHLWHGAPGLKCPLRT